MSDDKGAFRVSGWSGLFWKLLLGCALLLGAYAWAGSLTQATYGVGLICLACLIAIAARINQAELHHRQRLEADHGRRVLEEPTAPPKERVSFVSSDGSPTP